MSATARVAAVPQQRQPLVDERPAELSLPLRLLQAPRSQAPRKPYVLLLSGMLTAGLLGSLLLNTVNSQNSFVIHDLRGDVKKLNQEEQALIQKVAEQESPIALTQRARALGMVPSASPVFLRLSDGRILGVPTAAKAGPKPAPKPVKAVAQPVVAAKPTVAGKPTTAVKPASPKAATKAATKPATKPGGGQ